jgi:hypothetical protein
MYLRFEVQMAVNLGLLHFEIGWPTGTYISEPSVGSSLVRCKRSGKKWK